MRSSALGRESDARTRAHSKSPATAGRNTTGENLRKLRKLLSTLVRISPISRLSFRAKSRNLSIFALTPAGKVPASPRSTYACLFAENINAGKKRAGLRRALVVLAIPSTLWQIHNGRVGGPVVERGSTSVVGGGGVDVVREGKRQRCASTVGYF